MVEVECKSKVRNGLAFSQSEDPSRTRTINKYFTPFESLSSGPSHPPTHVKARSVRISCSMLLNHDVLYFTLIIVLKGRKIKSMVGPIISLPIECEA